MTTLRTQVTIDADSALPRDAAVNTWHFSSDSVDPLDDATEIHAALIGFYQEIQAVFSSGCAGTGTLKSYNLVDPIPRNPILESGLTFTPDTSPRLPNECAIALSYRGQLVSGANAARRRGRIFIGPLTSDVVTAGTGGDALVTSTARSLIADAAQTMAALGGVITWQWAVFSPTTAGPEPWSVGELAGATLPVEFAYVDDAFDTIRSRGQRATARTNISISP